MKTDDTTAARRGSTWPVLAPSVVSLGAGVLALGLAWLGGSRDAVEYCLFGIYAGLALTVVSILLIAYLPYPDRLLRCLVLLALTVLSTVIGGAIWAQAIDVSCLPGTSCPFG